MKCFKVTQYNRIYLDKNYTFRILHVGYSPNNKDKLNISCNLLTLNYKKQKK